MKSSITHNVQLYTTPQQLREWADVLQKKWEKSLIGDSLAAVTIFGEGITVNIVVDQELMNASEMR